MSQSVNNVPPWTHSSQSQTQSGPPSKNSKSTTSSKRQLNSSVCAEKNTSMCQSSTKTMDTPLSISLDTTSGCFNNQTGTGASVMSGTTPNTHAKYSKKNMDLRAYCLPISKHSNEFARSTSEPFVFLADGVAITTSQFVADFFGKDHSKVLRDIRLLIEQCGEKFNESNFGLVEYTDAKGERRPAYRLTRDGFTLLAMGFTGKKALAFKLAYIDAFNKMEAALHARTGLTLTTAQKQHLHELVDLIAASGKQTHAETWSRLHRKFHVNSYHQLTQSNFDSACQYLLGKMDGNDIRSLVQKHFGAVALAAPQLPPLVIPEVLPSGKGTRNIEVTKRLNAAIKVWAENLPEPSRNELRGACDVLHGLLVTCWTEVDEALRSINQGTHFLRRWQGKAN